MKKLLTTTALLAVLATPAFAADITISGASEWSWQDSNSVTSTDLDANVTIGMGMTTDTGYTISADFNINQDAEDDGGNSLKIANDEFTLDMGDTNSALDAIDDKTDFTYVLGNGSPSLDHAALLTISPIEGLTLNGSYAADSNYGTTATAGYAYSATYTTGFATLGGGKLINDDGSEATLYNVSASISGLTASYEIHTDTTAASVDTDTTTMGATYSIGDTLIGVETMETESVNVVSSDEITYGIQHTIAPGLTVFAEYTDDEKTDSEETTAVGISAKF